MDLSINENFRLANLYSFVKTEVPRTNSEYQKQRQWEHNLMTKQRFAVNFCKSLHAINTCDMSKIGNEEKASIEECLKENFLAKDPNYFGNRDTVILDLHNY